MTTMNIDDLIREDLAHVWHPTSQMKDYEAFPPLPIVGAQGAYLELADGRRILDAISSWWCKSLGHGHPDLRTAAKRQIDQFEHVILANTTHRPIVELSKKLAQLTDSLDHAFYASDGACAVEIAVKMAIRSQQLLGRSKRTQLMALSNGYHGETIMTLALSDVPLFRQDYAALLPKVTLLQGIPYVSSVQSPLWSDCSASWSAIEAQLDMQVDQLAAIVLEPIVQGAGGMLIYSQDFLHRLRDWCTLNSVYLIADEIMTGFGRTGRPLACQHAHIEPDFLCLAKGLTAGWLPMSVVLTSTAIYRLFYDTYESGKAFLHSHTHTGNSLAAAVALACFEVMEKEAIYDKVQDHEPFLAMLMQDVKNKTGEKLTNIRHIGCLVAADLVVHKSNNQRWGYRVYQEAVKRGALLRPVGNTIYWLPPLNIERSDLVRLHDITVEAIRAVDF